jgi:hypothetical protein
VIEKERYPDDPSFPRRGFRGLPLTSPLNITDRRAVTVIDMKKRRIKSCQLDRAGRRINERKNQVRERCPTCVFFHLRQPEKRPTKEIFGGESVDGGRRVANQKSSIPRSLLSHEPSRREGRGARAYQYPAAKLIRAQFPESSRWR